MSRIILLVVYVDDLVIIGNDTSGILSLKSLHSNYNRMDQITTHGDQMFITLLGVVKYAPPSFLVIMFTPSLSRGLDSSQISTKEIPYKILLCTKSKTSLFMTKKALTNLLSNY